MAPRSKAPVPKLPARPRNIAPASERHGPMSTLLVFSSCSLMAGLLKYSLHAQSGYRRSPHSRQCSSFKGETVIKMVLG
ncbi:hypothetical protein BS47DRAFT_1341474 [Hydnum rufescens UP504]|uniref:Uncharacterized protein n=1 Tax=Hydnum rufescens UP504 TaxID=1448309 RepID=A0A9P6B1P3_9AGAM|nr:hypothetical protein BS47DRAFT_1341474 [Hydnum rufescens UP504]